MNKKERNKQEVDLISDFNMEYGNEENWSDEVKADFDIKWKAIQRRHTKPRFEKRGMTLLKGRIG